MSNEKNRPLWAPWRIKFIRSPKDSKCFLCHKQTPDKTNEDEDIILKRGKYTFVILNKYPYNSGHIMVAPYRHIDDISLLTKEERYELIDMIIEAKNVLSEILKPDAFNAGFNLGSAAGAGLKEHIHFHIVPRWEGDNNFMPVLANTRVVPESLEATANLIKQHWRKKHENNNP